MKTFLVGLAYFLIYTTPIGVGVTLWIFWILIFTEQTIFSLSMGTFLQENPNFLRSWAYTWFWNDFLDFWWALPASVLSTTKLILNTWLGFWLLPIAKDMV